MPLQFDDLGFRTNVDVLKSFIDIKGMNVIDAGCGGMTFTRHLSELGGNVLAIDPDPVQAELIRNGETLERIKFIEASADNLPADDDSIDGVFFSYSLHHVPAELYPRVFSEVKRVLKPDGFLYVIEPIDCPMNQVMKLFHNEDRERALAQDALQTLAGPIFEEASFVQYHGYREYDSFEHFAEFFTSKSFNTYQTKNVTAPEVRAAFEKHGAPNYKFASPKMVGYFKHVKV